LKGGLLFKNDLANGVKEAPDLSVRQAAAALNISKSSLYNHWYSNLTPKRFLLSKRLFMALKLIARDKKIGEIAQELKFCDHIYFCLWFKRYCGISPKQFQLKYGSDFRNGRYDKICKELEEIGKVLNGQVIPQSGRETFPRLNGSISRDLSLLMNREQNERR
jgi:AraC-like DNA-binding protein